MRAALSAAALRHRRNTPLWWRYRAHISDQRAWDRALRPKQCHLARHPHLAALVAQKLRLDWSPQQRFGAWSENPRVGGSIPPLATISGGTSTEKAGQTKQTGERRARNSRATFAVAGAGNVIMAAGLRATAKAMDNPPEPNVAAPVLDLNNELQAAWIPSLVIAIPQRKQSPL
jgi:hypothetical protein